MVVQYIKRESENIAVSLLCIETIHDEYTIVRFYLWIWTRVQSIQLLLLKAWESRQKRNFLFYKARVNIVGHDCRPKYMNLSRLVALSANEEMFCNQFTFASVVAKSFLTRGAVVCLDFQCVLRSSQLFNGKSST